MTMAKAVGIYGGTFDPVHFGHINLALEILERRSLDEVWFCPAFQNPHKQDGKQVEAKHRLAMLALALEKIPQFKILTNEIDRMGPSYTIDTLREILAGEQEEAKPNKFFLILGQDSLTNFFRWRQPEEIVRLAPPLIGMRSGNDPVECCQGEPEIINAFRKGITIIPMLDISATVIRNRLQNGLFCGHLLPKEVLDYIELFALYS